VTSGAGLGSVCTLDGGRCRVTDENQIDDAAQLPKARASCDTRVESPPTDAYRSGPSNDKMTIRCGSATAGTSLSSACPLQSLRL